MQTNSGSSVNAIAGGNRLARFTRSIGLVLLGTIVIVVASKISVPFYPVPMTLQTLAIMALAAFYGSRLAVATVIAYLAEGAAGLPVFTSTPPQAAGLPYFLGPTGGFLAGFIILAGIVGLAADQRWDRSFVKFLGAVLSAEILTFALGFAWLAWFIALPNGIEGLGVSAAFRGGVMPFVLGEAFKIALIVLAIPAGKAIIRRLRGAA